MTALHLLAVSLFLLEPVLGLRCYTSSLSNKASKDDLDNYYYKEDVHACNFTQVYKKLGPYSVNSNYKFWSNHSKDEPACYKVTIKPAEGDGQAYIVKKGCYPAGTCEWMKGAAQEASDFGGVAETSIECHECNEDGCNPATTAGSCLAAMLPVMATGRHYFL